MFRINKFSVINKEMILGKMEYSITGFTGFITKPQDKPQDKPD
jgi:hypothetical protein